MRTFCRLLILVVAGQSAAAVSLAGSKADVRAILDKAIAAHGGTEKLAKQRSMVWKAKGTINLGGMKQPYTAQYAFSDPNKLRFDLEMDFGGMKVELTVVSDGKTAWEKSGGEAREMDKEKFKEFQHTAYTMHVTNLLPLKAKAFSLAPLSEGKVGKNAVVGIKVSREGNRDVNLFFDKKTGLLAKAQARVFDEFAKKEVDQETLFEGYRDVDGMKVFDRMTIKRDEDVFLEETFTSQRSLEKGDAMLFSNPTK